MYICNNQWKLEINLLRYSYLCSWIFAKSSSGPALPYGGMSMLMLNRFTPQKQWLDNGSGNDLLCFINISKTWRVPNFFLHVVTTTHWVPRWFEERNNVAWRQTRQIKGNQRPLAKGDSPSIAFLLKYNTTQGFCAGENANHIYVISVLNHSTADDSFQIGPVSADDFISSARKFVNRAETLDLIGPKLGFLPIESWCFPKYLSLLGRKITSLRT